MNNILLWNLGGMEILLIVLLIVLLFGGKKIPELMKGLGKGMKSFKQGVAEAEAEIKKTKDEIDHPVETTKKTVQEDKTEKEK